MRLQILLIPLLQVALVESLREVYGYLGHKVTLPSGANPSWNLTKIEWSIFSNNTYIATYRAGVVNVKRVKQYEGRLSLNNSSGDLTIHNLTQSDAMEYTVELNTENQNNDDKIMLIVRKHLQKPNIQTQVLGPSKFTQGGCWMEAHCSSSDKDVTFSWRIKPPSVITQKDPDGHSAIIVAFLNTTQDSVEFTCISSSKTDNATSAVTNKCEDENPPPLPSPSSLPRSRHALVFFTGVLIGVLATIIITIIFGEQIKNAWETIKGKLCI